MDELDAELTDNPDTDRVEAEVGDLLFSVVNLARKLGCDPRSALEKANARFDGRFRKVEQVAQQREMDLGRASLEELDALWEEAKAGDRG